MLPCTLGWVDEDTLVLSIPIVAIVGGVSLAIIKTVVRSMRDTAMRREVEQSRREVAAYVAEGSMSPEDARRLIEADPANLKSRR